LRSKLLLVAAALAVVAVPGAAARSSPELRLLSLGPAVISPNGNGVNDTLRLRVEAPPGSVLGLRAYRWGGRLVGSRRGRFEPALEVRGFGRAAFVLVANADPYTYAGRLAVHVAPEARFELGLDVVAPTRVGPLALPRLLRYVLTGRGQTEARDVLYGHDLDRIEIVCDRPLPLQADGEDLGDVQEAVFEAERDAIAVLI